MQAPITAKMTITTPNGLSALVTKIVDAYNANDLLSFKKLTTKVTSNGRTSTSVYETASKTVTTKSASGRVKIGDRPHLMFCLVPNVSLGMPVSQALLGE